MCVKDIKKDMIYLNELKLNTPPNSPYSLCYFGGGNLCKYIDILYYCIIY